MNKRQTSFWCISALAALLLSACAQRATDPYAGLDQDTLIVRAARFTAGEHMVVRKDSVTSLRFVLEERKLLPFNQANIHQTTEQAQLGPSADIPFFTVRFALPVPPAYNPTETGELTGIDAGVYHHNHSPGFEIMPNGDALAIYFSTPRGRAEKDPLTTFVQARLRHGSEDWDMPERFFETLGGNDQSGLLWNDNGKIWFFGGGRSMSDYLPFRIATSTDNGFHWEFSVPQLDTIATDYTAQPVSNAFRDPDGNIYFVCDADRAQSFLWRSTDEGKTWHDMGGRTGTRHTALVPLEDGTLLAMGGKNNNCQRWNVKNISTDWGATWSENEPSYFPVLGTAQRPALIRLASGALLYAGDGYAHKQKVAPPESWSYGRSAVIAISDDEGKTWKIKNLPVQLPHQSRPPVGSLGYCTLRQAPNGVIHLLTSANLPGLHYEFNEAWVRSDLGDTSSEQPYDGEIRSYTEHYPNGALKSTWSARICSNGRYLLHGDQKDYFDTGALEHEVTYENGRKSGIERFYTKEGVLRWQWERDLQSNRGVWTHYHPNGAKKIESHWNLKPEPRDLKRTFYGYMAEGETLHFDEEGNQTAVYRFKNGLLQE